MLHIVYTLVANKTFRRENSMQARITTMKILFKIKYFFPISVFKTFFDSEYQEKERRLTYEIWQLATLISAEA